jgi:protein containing cell adhesion domain protein
VDGTELAAVCQVTVLPAIESVELSDTALTLQPEETAQLTYTVAPEEALADNVTYTSSDETVATVDAEGNVTAIADGTATITVDVNGVTAECEVTVATKAASTVGNSNNGSSAASSGQTQDSSAASSSSFEYGAIPFSLANDDTWWAIDQSDSAYWAVLNNINSMRAAGGLSALSPSSSLDAIADSRCDYQLVNDTLSHDGAQTPEILAQSQKSASEVCTGWQNSPSHYAVIMNPNFTQIGICCYFEIGGKTIWCCTFG